MDMQTPRYNINSLITTCFHSRIDRTPSCQGWHTGTIQIMFTIYWHVCVNIEQS